MAKVTLISVNDVVYELGIRSLSAYLKRHGHTVQMVFMNDTHDRLSAAAVMDLVELCAGSALVGLSLLTHSVDKAATVTRMLKSFHPGIPVLWGGIHATGFPDESLQYADMVCLGEGEETILELVERLSSGQSCGRVQNVCTRDAGSVRRNPVRPLIQNLDDLPFQDYTLEREYVTEGGRLVRMNGRKFLERMLFYSFADMGHAYVTMTSRGCPFNCTFCCNDVLRKLYKGHRPYVRKRSVENVIREIAEVKQRHAFFSSVMLEDDSFLFRSLDDIRAFCECYDREIALPFGIEMNPNEVSEQKIAMLKDAGLNLVHVGIQSGDQDIRRRYYNRSTPDSSIYETNRVLTKYDILHKYDIIIDTPFDGDATASLRMLRKFRAPFSVNLYSLRVYPGLALERVIREAGFVEWLAANDNKVSYNDILSDDPVSFALGFYKTFPPTRRSLATARVFGSRPMIALMSRALSSWTARHLISKVRRFRGAG